MQLALRNSPAKIRTTFVDGDGAAKEPTAPTVTIVRDSDGLEFVSAALATKEDDGVVSYTLNSSDIPTVDLLRVFWGASDAAAPDSEVGVVGGFLCSLEAISAAVVAGGGTAPDATVLREKREDAEERLEGACGVAFRPSYHRETLAGDGTQELLLSHPRPLEILSAELDGEDVKADLSVTSNGLVHGATSFRAGAELEIVYAHGWPVCPETVSRAAVKLAAAFIEAADDRVTRFREDDQEFFLSTPGPGNTTGIPEVDQVIRDYGGYGVVG